MQPKQIIQSNQFLEKYHLKTPLEGTLLCSITCLTLEISKLSVNLQFSVMVLSKFEVFFQKLNFFFRKMLKILKKRL